MASVIDRTQKALPFPLQAPVGGLNARDALANMPPQDASVFTNLFPHADRVETRPGFATLATATPTAPSLGSIEGFRVLMNRGTTIYGAWFWGEVVAAVLYKRLRIYSISAAGTLSNVREVVTTGGTNSLESVGEWCNFTSASGTKYLLFATSQWIGGVGTYVLTAYDGGSWTTPTITGVPANTSGITVHRNRLWFYGAIQSNLIAATKPLSAYYLPTGAVSGTVAEFNIGPFATKGGEICAVRTWTLDGGDGGTDDLCCFLTTAGQLIVYSGTDPSSSSTWALVGVFDIAIPASSIMNNLDNNGGDTFTFIKDAFALKYGVDMLLTLTAGVSTATGILRGGVDTDYSISSKIRPLLTDVARTSSSAGGLVPSTTIGFSQWKLVYLATRKTLMLSIPTDAAGTTAGNVTTWAITGCKVFVMNAETGAWARYDNMNILDALPVGNNIYFIDGSHKVYKYGEATSDDGSVITFECRQAYSYFNSPNNKLVTLAQPRLYATGNFSMTFAVDADFKAGSISAYTSYTASNQNVQPQLSPSQYGRALAGHMKGQTSAGVVSWYATNYIYRNAGIL